MKSWVPYPTLVGDVQLDVTSGRIDGQLLDYRTRFAREQQTVALNEVERADWKEARFEVRVTLPGSEIDSGTWEKVVCVAVLSEGATNTRSVTELTRGPGTTWTGRVLLPRGMYRSRAVLTASVVATVDGVEGRVIGSTEQPWYIDLTAREPIRERELNIVEIDFRGGPEEWLRPFKDAPWLVDATGDMPTVWLNTGFEGLVELLHGSGNPVEKAMREVVAAQIAEEAWTAMFHSAVTDLDFDDNRTPRLPSGWRGTVLASMLPDVVPSTPLEDALREVHLRRSDGQGWAELQTNVQYAASRHSKVPKGLKDAVRALHRADEGNRR
ncbi:hypothetical protein [Streptomyces sp. UNOC14_S4]|uniref:hypothetical protein n=1 Tax=Streptomyces sp. UNOC14_S4 TaxID=2872340 RepID=UPI001E53B7B5|nr:hypothetical protein [Streptomyces sp. UNOC14_S4]MCC3767194.1 hypothetical protein [Streptomyces sp. UNOC14_S4]